MRSVRVLLLALALLPLGCAAGSRPGAGPPVGLDTPGDHERSIEYGGRSRFYLTHIPPGYQRGAPTPVVLVFHGGGGYPEAMKYQTKMDAVADRHGFIVAYPAGTGVQKRRLLTFNAGNCCSYAVEHQIDDVGFTRAVIGDLASYLSIDPKRIYATGLSNGAILAQRLACELSDRIAAIGPVAGTMGMDSCRPTRPVSIIEFHGLADRNVPYAGGVGAGSFSRVNYRSVADTIDFWINFDGCPREPNVTVKGAATAKLYGPCKGGTEVILWSLEGGGHTWPGGDTTALEKMIRLGAVNRDISASEEMWEFFVRHPMN